MSKVRHWRQKFDPNAEMIFLKPLTLNGQRVGPGSDMTPEQRALIGLKLKSWWNAGFIALKHTPMPGHPAKAILDLVQTPEAQVETPTSPLTPPARRRGRPRKNPAE